LQCTLERGFFSGRASQSVGSLNDTEEEYRGVAIQQSVARPGVPITALERPTTGRVWGASLVCSASVPGSPF
jgi:hypothetical protein